jgi:hypothetical protein
MHEKPIQVLRNKQMDRANLLSSDQLVLEILGML